MSTEKEVWEWIKEQRWLLLASNERHHWFLVSTGEVVRLVIKKDELEITNAVQKKWLFALYPSPKGEKCQQT